MKRNNAALKIAAILSSLTLLVGFVSLRATGSLPWPFETRSREPAVERQTVGGPQAEASSPTPPERDELIFSSKSMVGKTWSVGPVHTEVESDDSAATEKPTVVPWLRGELMPSSKSTIVVQPSGNETVVIEPSLPPDSDPFGGVAGSIPGPPPAGRTGLPAPIAPAAQTGPPAANAPPQRQPAQQTPAAPRKLILPGSKAPAGLGSHY